MIQGIVTTLENSDGHTKYYIVWVLRKVNKKDKYLTTEITSSQFYELQKAGYLYVYNQEINKLRNKLNQ